MTGEPIPGAGRGDLRHHRGRRPGGPRPAFPLRNSRICDLTRKQTFWP